MPAVEDVLLEQRVEGLHRGVVTGRGDPSHRSPEPGRLEDGPDGPRAELPCSVGVDDHGARGLSAGDRLAQGRRRQLGSHAGPEGIADDAPGAQVLQETAVELALGCSVMSVSQTSSGWAAVKPRWIKSSWTAGPGSLPAARRPFFVVTDQIRCSRHSRWTRFSLARWPAAS